MNHLDASKEIADLNLTYMLVAQKLLRQDRASAMLRLGVTEELADMLIGMSLAQIIKLATSNFVLCAFRLDELPIVKLVQDTRETSLQQAHLSIVLAGSKKRAGIPASA